jgi:Ca2+-binding RTX toxin-like protein
MSIRAGGGDDFLHSKTGGSELYGDALGMYDTAKGGNDVLSGSSGRDLLIGEAWYLSDETMAGDDVLLGGKGNDRLYGDAVVRDDTAETGADRFVFGGASGKDTIGDFEHGKDVIDVQRLGYTDLLQLTIDVSGGNSIVHFRGTDQVTVLGVTDLDATDFLFA